MFWCCMGDPTGMSWICLSVSSQLDLTKPPPKESWGEKKRGLLDWLPPGAAVGRWDSRIFCKMKI